MKIFQLIDLKGKSALLVRNNNKEFVDIVRSLLVENKELKKRVEIMEEILYSYLPILDSDNDNKVRE